jgi:hypothetical protein
MKQGDWDISVYAGNSTKYVICCDPARERGEERPRALVVGVQPQRAPRWMLSRKAHPVRIGGSSRGCGRRLVAVTKHMASWRMPELQPFRGPRERPTLS